MGSDKINLSGVVETVSRQAGAAVGASVAVSKKITASGVKGAAAVRDLVTRTVRKSVPVTDKLAGPASETSGLNKEAAAREGAMRAQVAVLQSDLAVAQRELKKARSGEKKRAHTELIAKIRAEADEAIAKAKAEAAEAATKVKADTEEKVAKLKSEAKEESEAYTQKIAKTKEPKTLNPAAVTQEQVRAAVFSDTTEKIIFARALSDVSSHDTAARADAARVMAGVHHDLSVKALVAQMAREPSAQVRQECIKALTALKTKEALAAVDRALSDRAASVRLAAVWGLYHLNGAKNTSALVHMLSDEDKDVRRRAATCIGWLGQEELAVELLPLLADSSVLVRRAAVEAMSSLRCRQVVSALLERLNDPDESIRKVVLRAIQTITGKKMSGPSPKSKKSFERLVARWREWWKEEYLK
jgi:HEAT repeat protein